MGDRPNLNELHTLKVDNIPHRAHPDDIKDAFSRFGEVGDVYIPRDHHTQQSRGFAFVRFYDKRDAEDAARDMDGHDFEGRELRVQFAQRRRPDNPREFYRERFNQRRGGRSRDRYDDRRHRSRSRDRRRYDSRDRHDDRRRDDRRSSRDRSRGRDDRRSPDRRSDERRSRTPDRRSEEDRRSRTPERRSNDRRSPEGDDRRSNDRRSGSADRRD